MFRFPCNGLPRTLSGPGHADRGAAARGRRARRRSRPGGHLRAAQQRQADGLQASLVVSAYNASASCSAELLRRRCFLCGPYA